MMKEILFRAKTINDNPKWVYGYYAKTAHDIGIPSGIPIIVDDNGDWDKIDPETLCQFTGLYDKDGTRVFEGDILQISKRRGVLGAYYDSDIPNPCNVTVKWDWCAWMWEMISKDKRYISFPNAWCHYYCEVIGNIYDNPELLEGENK